MAFSKHFTLSMIAALSLMACGLTACDDDDDNGAGTTTTTTTTPNCNKGKQGFAATCECLSKTTDFTKVGKKPIADYLASICKLSTYFTEDAFQNTPTEEQGIGANCFCYGKNCSMSGYERPELQASGLGVIYGCDNVPEEFNGAVRSCFRSTSIPTIKPQIYFPNGTCALAMSKCFPSEECTPGIDDTDPKNPCTPEIAKEKNEKTICGFAKFGEYAPENFTSCPEGSDGVLVDFAMNIEIIDLGRKAKLDVRTCFQGCETDADCKGAGVFDPITQETAEQAQYKCIDTDPAVSGDFVGKKTKICFDRRTIKDASSGIVLVNPGKFKAE